MGVFTKQEKRDLKEVIEEAIDNCEFHYEDLEGEELEEVKEYVQRLRDLKAKISKV